VTLILSSIPTPSRVVLARTRRGLTKAKLAKRAGISTRTLYEIEAGRAIPTRETVEAIAEATRFPMDFFYRPDIESPTPSVASFRSLRSMTAGQRDAALAAGALAFEIGVWIDRRFHLTVQSLPDLREYDPEAAAVAVRAHLGIGVRPIGNMVHLLESVGIRVFSMAEDRRVDAFSLWHHELPFVFLNTVKTAEHSRMDAAHELGHLVLHRHGARWGRDVEKDAQACASAFLMPTESLRAIPKLLAPTLNHLFQLKKNWGVSAAALAYRMHQLEMLSDWHYRNICVQLSRLGRTMEPFGLERETSQVMAKVFDPKSGASKADVCRDLAIYPADVESLVFGLRAAEPAERPINRRHGQKSPPRLFRVV
jgi:Zn-dependent peptidase ImmA (M78 family)/DNA-binding XRE family transcriptional regulator